MAAAKRAKKTKSKPAAKKASKKASNPKAKKVVAKRKTNKSSKTAKFVADVIKQATSAHRVATRETKALSKALSTLGKKGEQLSKQLAKAKSPKSIEAKVAKNDKLINAAKESLQSSQTVMDNIASLLDVAKKIESNPAKRESGKKATNEQPAALSVVE